MCKNNQTSNKAVAYIDILGFSQAVNKNVEDAINVLNSFNAIINIELFEKVVHPSSSYSHSLKKIARQRSVESFEDFLPFSDSVFITSMNCNDFIFQLSSFIYKSFKFTSDHYAHPIDKDDPTLTYNIGLDNQGQPCKIPCHVPPVLFRGGLSYGEVIPLQPNAIINGKQSIAHTLAGKAVVKAVSFDSLKLKGPRIFFGNDIFEQLDETAKSYCRIIPERIDVEHTIYEILWPSICIIRENPYTTEYIHYFEILNAAFNLWRPYKDDEEVRIQYEKFIELILASMVQSYDTVWGQKDYITKKIKDYINAKDITESLRACIQQYI